MNNEQQLHQEEIIRRAVKGEKEYLDAICNMIEEPLKRIVNRRVSKFVNVQDVDDVRHDMIVRVLERIHQLENPDAFHAWLQAIGRDVAREYRAPFLKSQKEIVPDEEIGEKHRPKQIETKWQLIDGMLYPVKVFEPSCCSDEAPRTISLRETFDDRTIFSLSNDQRLDPSGSIDFRDSLKGLPLPWLVALTLVYKHGYSREEVAEIFGLDNKRPIYRIFRKARQRLRESMPGYRLNNKPDDRNAPPNTTSEKSSTNNVSAPTPKKRRSLVVRVSTVRSLARQGERKRVCATQSHHPKKFS